MNYNIRPSHINNHHYYFGITPPLNDAQPTEEQLKENSKFFETINELKLCVPNSSTDSDLLLKLKTRNKNILQDLTKIFNDWANHFIFDQIKIHNANSANISPNTHPHSPIDIAKMLNLKIQPTQSDQSNRENQRKHQQQKHTYYQLTRLYSFGSYRLGLITSGGDLDVLMIGPKYISRQDFFNKFVPQNLNSHVNSKITMVNPVPNAHIPIVKIIYDGVPIDIVYTSIPYLNAIDQNFDIDNDYHMERLLSPEFKDEKTAHSLNGKRVTDSILRSVPDIETFKCALTYLKYWAKVRGIYGNIYGYLSGVSLAILTARICQLYPNSLPVTIVKEFFKFYSIWKWPCPILLDHLKTQSSQFYGMNDLMPILTCSYPVMNTTYNICQSTREIILREISRASVLDSSFTEIVQPFDFFNSFKHYLKIELNVDFDYHYDKQPSRIQIPRCIPSELHSNLIKALESWTGWCESRLRLFVNKLSEESNYLNRIQVFPHPHKYKQLQLLERVVHENVQIQNDHKNSQKIISHKNVFYIGLTFTKLKSKVSQSQSQLQPSQNWQKKSDIQVKNQIDLSKAVEYYKNLTNSWPEFFSNSGNTTEPQSHISSYNYHVNILHLSKKQVLIDIKQNK